jgi:CDP-6-deoxy-D-xylo-4-hexulose-3-dehydrase
MQLRIQRKPARGGRDGRARHWKPGDEIITVAACFPTTINPLLLYGLKPVFVDIQLPTYNVNLDHVLRAVSYKTRGIVLAHTLGNPFDVALYRIAERFGLKVIEDCCDALGAMYDGSARRHAR